MTIIDKIERVLPSKAGGLLNHVATAIPKEKLHLPHPDFVTSAFGHSDRNPQVLKSLQSIYSHGRLGGTGYLSILPCDQGIEHSAAASFAPNPIFFDPKNIIELAINAGCNAVASTYEVLASQSRTYAHKIPFIVKINHNELLSYPSTYNQIMFGSVDRAWELGATGIGATIYFGSPESERQIQEVATAFERAHELGMATILWCYLRNPGFKKDGIDYHTSADLTGQANHIGVTIGADIIKQKLPTNNGGFNAIEVGKTHPNIYNNMTTENPIDLCRYQLANTYMGLRGLINSGGASKGEDDLAEVIETAIINKRAGGSGLILGRKAFQKSMKEGVAIINTVQDVYLCDDITIA